MSKPLFLLPLLLFAYSCTSDAFATPPVAMSDSESYSRIGGSHWGRSWEPPASLATATDGIVLDTPGDTSYTLGDQHLWSWGDSIRISCDADAQFAWILDTDITIATTGLISDASGTPSTGAGHNIRVEAGTYIEEVLMRTMFPQGGVGRRTGFCSPTTLGAQYVYGGWPCSADADCPSSGACRGEANGSCIESSVNWCSNNTTPFGMIKGAFLTSIGAATENCYITNVR